MIKARVIKQDNASMYGVARIIVEAEFRVDYLHTDATQEQRIVKEFKGTLRS